MEHVGDATSVCHTSVFTRQQFKMNNRLFVALTWFAVALASPAGRLPAAPLEHRWVYLGTNLLVDKNVETALASYGAGGQGRLQRRGAHRQQIHALGPAAERIAKRPPRSPGLPRPEAR